MPGNVLKKLGFLSCLVLGMFLLSGCSHGGEGSSSIAGTATVRWRGGEPAKISDSLVLEAPSEGPVLHPAIPRSRIRADRLPMADGFFFTLYFPDLSLAVPPGHTVSAQWDPDRVEVHVWPTHQPPINAGTLYADEHGHQPVIDSAIRFGNLREGGFAIMEGLHCWAAPMGGNECEDPKAPSAIYLRVDIPRPRYAVNPMLQAEYLSSKYHGVFLYWCTGAKHFPQWREIDRRAWQVIEAWNVADSSAQGRSMVPLRPTFEGAH